MRRRWWKLQRVNTAKSSEPLVLRGFLRDETSHNVVKTTIYPFEHGGKLTEKRECLRCAAVRWHLCGRDANSRQIVAQRNQDHRLRWRHCSPMWMLWARLWTVGLQLGKRQLLPMHEVVDELTETTDHWLLPSQTLAIQFQRLSKLSIRTG